MCRKNFPDLQKLSGQHCWLADGVFATLLFPPEGGEGWTRGRGRVSRSMSYSDEALSSGSVFLRSVPLGICISQICISRDLYFSDKCLSGSVFLRFIFFSWTTYTSCPEKTIFSGSHAFSMNFSARVERNLTPTSYRVFCFLAIFFSIWFASYVNIMGTALALSHTS